MRQMLAVPMRFRTAPYLMKLEIRRERLRISRDQMMITILLRQIGPER